MKNIKQQLPTQLLPRWLINGKSSANIVTLFQDLGAAARAKDFCDQLTAELPAQTVIVNAAWRFDLLAQSDRRQFEDTGVSSADIIIVSANAHAGLPAHVKSWLENQIRARNGQPAVLVALLGQEKMRPEHVRSFGSELRHLAEDGRLDYFCNTDGCWNVNLNLSLAPCLAEFGNEPMIAGSISDQDILSIPSVISQHAVPPHLPLCSVGEPGPAPRPYSQCRRANQNGQHLSANDECLDLLERGRIGKRSKCGQLSLIA